MEFLRSYLGYSNTCKFLGGLIIYALGLMQISGLKVTLIRNPEDPHGWPVWEISFKGDVARFYMQAETIGSRPFRLDVPSAKCVLLVPA